MPSELRALTKYFSYLGRYTHRVGLSNARIQYADAHGVTFTTKNGRTCTLRPVEFLRRLPSHVLPKGFHKIRHYGLCSTHHVAHGTLAELRDALAAPSANDRPRARSAKSTGNVYVDIRRATNPLSIRGIENRRSIDVYKMYRLEMIEQPRQRDVVTIART